MAEALLWRDFPTFDEPVHIPEEGHLTFLFFDNFVHELPGLEQQVFRFLREL